MRIRRGWLLLAVLMVVAAGCSGGEDAAGAAGTADADADAGEPAGDAEDPADGADEDADAEEGADTGDADAESRDVSLALYQTPTTFDPLITSLGPNHLIGQLHWDGLVAVDAENEYAPRLAESWEVSDDGLTWTFDLRDDMTWSDGEPFTSADVLFSFELYAHPESGSANAGKFATVEGVDEFVEGDADGVAGFEAPDDTTFVINLTEPNSGLLIELVQPILYVLPEHVVAEIPMAELTDDPFFREPTVGLGPYLFERWVTDDQIEFHANPEYPAELGLDRVFVSFLTTDVASAQLETGEIDYAEVAAADLGRIEGLDGVSVHRAEGPALMALHTAIDSGKLADARVRQAFLHAIDREALVEQVLAGEGKVVDTLIHGPDWAMPDDLVSYDYDPDRARELLDDAGWDPSTPVEISIIPGEAERDMTVTIVAGQLQEVGVNATVAQMEAAEQGELVEAREFDLLASIYGLFNLDPAAMNARLMCDQIGSANLTGYCNEELDALLEAGIATADEAERAEIYAEAQRLFNEEVPIFPMYVPNTLVATSNRLEGFELNASRSLNFLSAAEWSVTE